MLWVGLSWRKPWTTWPSSSAPSSPSTSCRGRGRTPCNPEHFQAYFPRSHELLWSSCAFSMSAFSCFFSARILRKLKRNGM